MGFFDQIIKDIASGDIDKKLEQIADTIDKFSGKLDDTVKKVAEKPEIVSETAKKIGTKTGKVMDIIKE